MDSTSPEPLTAGVFASVPTRALYSPKETEALLGISHATCYRLINAGRLDARKLDSKTVITRESIDKFIAELPQSGRAA
jgi:predicted DNA-binding transcriptional regulator AlpA